MVNLIEITNAIESAVCVIVVALICGFTMTIGFLISRIIAYVISLFYY